MDMSSMSSTDSQSTSNTTMSSMMSNVFTTITSTPLYSTAWTPATTGSYAGTCIFLIVLATISRCLAAGKHLLEHRWLDNELNRRYVSVRGTPTEVERINSDSRAKTGTLITERGVEEHVRVVRRKRKGVVPWRFSVDLPRAAYVMVLSGVQYLLMLAVMTFNVGYFMSVMGGIFLGELLVGRYAQLEEH
ncbi:MAG: hypothetical protein Q9191_005585 [Dirinaria sp. TL-2023a]